MSSRAVCASESNERPTNASAACGDLQRAWSEYRGTPSRSFARKHNVPSTSRSRSTRSWRFAISGARPWPLPTARVVVDAAAKHIESIVGETEKDRLFRLERGLRWRAFLPLPNRPGKPLAFNPTARRARWRPICRPFTHTDHVRVRAPKAGVGNPASFDRGRNRVGECTRAFFPERRPR